MTHEELYRLFLDNFSIDLDYEDFVEKYEAGDIRFNEYITDEETLGHMLVEEYHYECSDTLNGYLRPFFNFGAYGRWFINNHDAAITDKGLIIYY